MIWKGLKQNYNNKLRLRKFSFNILQISYNKLSDNEMLAQKDNQKYVRLNKETYVKT